MHWKRVGSWLTSHNLYYFKSTQQQIIKKDNFVMNITAPQCTKYQGHNQNSLEI